MSIPPLGLAARGSFDLSAIAKPTLLADGFRPFYLLAGAAAVLMIPCWMLVFFGVVPAHAYFPPTLWHVHEMLFGYTAAVMVGYLFTALPNWTGHPAPRGPMLAGLAALWLLGRVAVLIGGEWPPLLVAAIDVSFLPLAVLCILPPLLRARNLHNIAVPVSLLGLAGLNAAMHLEPAGVAALGDSAGRGALALITTILVIISGRVVPSFTASALPDAGVQRLPRLDALALAAVVVSLVTDAIRPETSASGILDLVAGVLLIARSAFWKPFATRSLPMLWILHLGHAWIALVPDARRLRSRRADAAVAGGSRAHGRCHRRDDARHDVALGARPYRPQHRRRPVARHVLRLHQCGGLGALSRPAYGSVPCRARDDRRDGVLDAGLRDLSRRLRAEVFRRPRRGEACHASRPRLAAARLIRRSVAKRGTDGAQDPGEI
jgi:uncharacterized protein involved in response to NO